MQLVEKDGLIHYMEDTGFNMVEHTVTLAQAKRVLDTAVDVMKCDKYKPYNVVVNGRFYFHTVEAEKTENGEEKPKRRGRKKVAG